MEVAAYGQQMHERFGFWPCVSARVACCEAAFLRLGSGCTLRTGSDCVLSGYGCVLRTASANISRSSALVGVEGFVILPLFLFRLRGFPGQTLSLQSFVIFPEGFPFCFVFR
jgi:hypothetical protein